MDRRFFVFRSGLIITGSAFLFHLLPGCSINGETNSELTEAFLKKGNGKPDNEQEEIEYVKELISESCEMRFTGLTNEFRQKRIVLLFSGYQIVNDKKDKFGRDIDFYIRFHLQGILKFNYDFYSSGFETGAVIVKKGVKHFISKNSGKEILVLEMPKTRKHIDFPVLITENMGKFQFSKNNRLPCAMKKTDMNQLFRDSVISGAINQLC
jgi:hypothetical protein